MKKHRITNRLSFVVTFRVALGLFFAGASPARGELVRFVRASETAGNSRFHLGELEAFLNGVTPDDAGGGSYGGMTTSNNDIADGSAVTHVATTTSSLAHGGANTDPDNAMQSGSAVWSTHGGLSSPEPRYTLDLGATFDVTTVRMWPRADTCCTDRWENLRVELLADDGGGNPGAVIATVDVGTPGGNIPQEVTFDPGGVTPTFFYIEGGLILLGLALAGYHLSRRMRASKV